MARRRDDGSLKDGEEVVPPEVKHSPPQGRSKMVTVEVRKKKTIPAQAENAKAANTNPGYRNLQAIAAGRMLVSAASTGAWQDVEGFLNENGDINFAHEETGFTALHYAASREIRALLRILIRHKELNYLARDKKGRLPSTLAFEIAGNALMGRFLMKKEMQQARERGVDYRALLTGEIDA